MTDNQKKLVNLLKEMFQFDQADLDFGIYRIMKMRRDEISRFIEQDLPEQITDGLQELAGASNAEKVADIDKKIAEIKNLGLDADVKAAQLSKFEAKKKSLENSTDISAVEADVYNHLTNFFGRYYDDGDFISQRRYKDGVYAIPYEGEEVKLYWANSDQYYVKTSEYFKDYTFKTGYGETIHFKLVEAETDKDNNKSNDKRFFQLHEEKPFEVIGRELFIYMEYKTGDKKKQDDYIADVVTAFTAVSSQYPDFSSILNIRDGKTELERQLTRYTARNTFDYFIHKDLKKFLNRELDFYIKNDVIFLDDIEEQDEAKTKEYLTKAKVIRKIARKIIDFLAQIEEFEKKLYLKKKFVVETNYCITLDRVPDEFYPEIAANEAQRKEWVRLFAIDEIEGNLTTVAYSEPLTVEFLKANPFLVLDTAFFSDVFKEKLIDSIDNLDENLDGLMIHSDNFQVLNLLHQRFENNISAIYIDPPYNTDQSEILYKNNYKDSSWLSMMHNRIIEAQPLMSTNCSMCVAIDDYAMVKMCQMIDDTMIDYERNIIVVNHHPQGTPKDNISRTHEYAVIMVPSGEQVMENQSDSEDVEYRAFMRSGSADNNYRSGRPNSFYAVLVDMNTQKVMGIEEPPALGTAYPRENTKEGYKRIYPLSKDGSERVWRSSYNSKELHEKNLNELIMCSKSGALYQIVKNKKVPINSNWIDKRYNAGTYGTALIKDIMGDASFFSYPKSLYTVEDFIKAATNSDEEQIVLDYFAGSGTTGHAIIDLNRADGGHRKYILVEMGEYFDTVTRPRIEKVVYSEDWKDGKPVSRKGSSHAFKYLRLESYEDALNNISLTDYDMTKLGDAKEGYFLSYMLNMESDGSVSLLNVDKLDRPFSYKMNITRNLESKERTVDLVETFNYLIGLKVERSYALASFDADFTTGEYGAVTAKLKSGKAYKIKMVEGTLPSGERALVIWREMTGDVVKDNAVLDAFFLRKKISTTDFEYRKIYVNCDNNLQNVRTDEENWKVILIEEEMKKRMFESVE